MSEYRIATWNVNSLRVRGEQLLEWLRTAQPDVVALQETKMQDPDFPLPAFTAAGYYSYKWAEVLAADAFSAFEEHGVFDRQIAQRFLDSILSQGGSRKALDAFVDFRGRPPDVNALLRQQGLAS